MRVLPALSCLLLLAAAPVVSPAAPERVSETGREDRVPVGERLSRIERILWERDAGGIPLLREWAVKDESDKVRERAVGALVTLRDVDASRIYTDRLATDPSPRVRRAAADAIGTLSIRVDRPERLTIPLRQDADPFVRAVCARAIARTGLREAFPHLLGALVQDPSPEVRALSAEALSTLKVTEAAGVLRTSAVQDPSVLVRAYAVRALAAIGPRDSKELFRTVWEQATEEELRLEAYQGLLLSVDAGAWVDTGLLDRDPQVRFLAFRKWESLHLPKWSENRLPRDSAVVLRLESFLKDPLRGIREGAKRTLEKVGYRVVETGSAYSIAGD